MYFQDLIIALQAYWGEQGCAILQPYDVEKGASTFNPATFLRALGPEPFNAAMAEPCRRPADGRYGDNPIRFQHYYQFQVIMKPSPPDLVERYLGSLEAIGIHSNEHDIRFVHDDWESPTLGAWGLGWEVWADGMEVTQFTYFQQVGGIELAPVSGEITYGLERLCMYIQGVDSVFDLAYNADLTYGDLFHENEVQCSKHNFEIADVELHLDQFSKFENECTRLCDADLPVAAVDYCLKASHSFNLLDARGAISVNERQGYILRVRALARSVAEAWLANREALEFPLLEKGQRTEDGGQKTEDGGQKMEGGGQKTEDGGQKTEDGGQSADKEERVPLLIELGVEEMPATVFRTLEKELPALFEKVIAPLDLEPTDTAFFFTPRRIVISIASIKTRQDDHVLEVKGPPLRIAKDDDGNWTKAAHGFAAKNDIELTSIETRDIKGETYLYYSGQQEGRDAADLLREAVPDLFSRIHWYKTMRWGSGTTAFVRPVKWLTVLLGDDIVPMTFAEVAAGGVSYGHRFLSPGPVCVSANKDAYLSSLHDAHVIVDHEARKGKIRDAVTSLAAANDVVWVEDNALLDEVTHLVEYPVPVLGSFDESFLEIPDAVIVSEMKTHQRYFALANADGTLSNRFVAISNMQVPDMDSVREGYEKVLRSRFADARFFLREDQKKTLASRVPELEQMIYQADLGTMAERTERIRALTKWLADRLEFDAESAAHADQIGMLCKADLTTSLVGEFPELQGEIGRFYAVQEGLPDVVADGILQHYLPKGADDAPAASAVAAIVGLADRIDHLTGIFAIGKAPTGSADPFALRRACLTSVRIIEQHGFRLDLRALLARSVSADKKILEQLDEGALVEQLLEFFRNRLQNLFVNTSRDDMPGPFAHDTFDAVVRASTPWYDIVDLTERLEALDAFRRRPDFGDVAATFKRTNNILRDVDVDGDPDPAKFADGEEKALGEAAERIGKETAACLAAGDYIGALAAIAPLRDDVNAFFDAVLVNDPDEAVRLNRQRLVKHVVSLVLQVADFAAIQSEGE